MNDESLVAEVARLTAERDEALGVRDGLVSSVQKVLEERRRAEGAEARCERLTAALEQVVTYCAQQWPPLPLWASSISAIAGTALTDTKTQSLRHGGDTE